VRNLADDAAMQSPPEPAGGSFQPPRPLVLGLVGGIAAGKSAVAAQFAAHGLLVIDADAMARAAAQEPATQRAIAAAFGPVVSADGALDRAALGRLVFADPSARARLEAILHPPILAAIEAQLAGACAAGRSVLLDAPLLLETGLDRLCDTVVFVAATPATRAARARSRGWTEAEWQGREAAQIPVAEKAARAAFAVQNDGDLAATAAQVAAVWHALATGPAPLRPEPADGQRQSPPAS